MCDKARKFNYLKSVKEDSTNPMGADALNKLHRAKEALKDLNLMDAASLPNASANYSVSIKGIAKQLNCSVGKAQGIVNSLCEDKLLKRITNCIIIASKSRSRHLHKHNIKGMLESKQNRWYSGGIVFQRKMNSYVF